MRPVCFGHKVGRMATEPGLFTSRFRPLTFPQSYDYPTDWMFLNLASIYR